MLLHANSMAPVWDLDCRYCGALPGEFCRSPDGGYFSRGGLTACHQPRRRKHIGRMGRLGMVRIVERQGFITVADIIKRNLVEE